MKKTSFVFVGLVCTVLAVSYLSGCGRDGRPAGEIRMLTYNVAGLPADLSKSDPVACIPLISPLLNGYDLVLVQEDFWYHDELAADAEHPYSSVPMWENPDWDTMGDGLNLFSVFAFDPVTRVQWVECHGFVDSGSDCLTTKGFLYTRIQPAPGIFIDLYNLHMDASGDSEDIAARRAGAQQLAAFIDEHSAGAALLLGGDTNLKERRDEDMVISEEFLAATGLTDVCRFLECGDERIDRIMFRSSQTVELEPLDWSLPPEFVNVDKEDLSDHLPVFSLISWRQI